MAKQNYSELFDEGVLVYDDTIALSCDQLIELVGDESFKSMMNNYQIKFLNYLEKETGIGFLLFPAQHITFFYDENYSYKMTISATGFEYTILRLLNCDLHKSSEIPTKIDELQHITNETDLKKFFPYLYDHLYIGLKRQASNELYKRFRLSYEFSRNDPVKFKKMKKDFGINKKSDEEIDDMYNKLLIASKFDVFIERTVEFFHKVSKKEVIQEIRKWAMNNPLNIKISEKNLSKVLLYTISHQVTNAVLNTLNGNYNYAQRLIIFSENMIKQYEKRYPNDTTEIIVKDTGFQGDEANNLLVTIDQVKKTLEELLSKHPNLKKNATLPAINKEASFNDNMQKTIDYINSILNETINDDIKQGAHDATKEVNNRVKQLEEEIESETISDMDKKEKTIILKKIKMVLNDIKPKAIQTGTGNIFRNYYVYYYDNGMVALDRIDGYGALYVMPVHIYKEARYKNNLTDVKNIPGVERVHHKNKDWLNIAKNYIENGTAGLTEEDIKKTEEVASIDFPYTVDKLEELEKMFAEENNEIGVEETKRRIRKSKELEKVDTELKDNEFDTYDDIPIEKREKVEQLDGEKEDVLNSEEIDEMVSSEKSFEELYEEWAKTHEKKKKSRSPVVAAITKRRSMNESGNYCCEWCGDEYTDTRPLRSHHVRPLSQGGPDNIYNTVCICPNCHDYVHSHVMTAEQQYRLFDVVRRHIEEENPEYLPQFYDLISPIAKDQEDYQKNKEIIDSNFDRQWSSGKVIFKR